MAQEARDRGTNTLTGFIEDQPLTPRSFDVVCGWHVLEHIPDPLPSMERLRVALRPAGLAVFEVPNFGGAFSRQKGAAWPYLDPEHHVNQFSPAAVRTLLTVAGYDVREITTVPMGIYAPLRETFKPGPLARRTRYAFRTRTKGFGNHPTRFDLLRVIAQSRS